MEKPKEKQQDGIMTNVPFRSAEHGGDFVMHTETDEAFPEIFPAEVIHFRKPTEEQWKAYMEFLIKKFGVDEIKDCVKKYEGQKEWAEHVKWAVEKIKSHEEKNPEFSACVYPARCHHLPHCPPKHLKNAQTQ
jgi:hypothetical protein